VNQFLAKLLGVVADLLGNPCGAFNQRIAFKPDEHQNNEAAGPAGPVIRHS
jgi:hypothetical protein